MVESYPIANSICIFCTTGGCEARGAGRHIGHKLRVSGDVGRYTRYSQVRPDSFLLFSFNSFVVNSLIYTHYRCLHRTQRPGLTIRQQSGTPGKRLVTSLLGQILNSFTEATPTYLDYNAPIFETRLHVLQNNCLNYNQSLTTTLI